MKNDLTGRLKRPLDELALGGVYMKMAYHPKRSGKGKANRAAGLTVPAKVPDPGSG